MTPDLRPRAAAGSRASHARAQSRRPGAEQGARRAASACLALLLLAPAAAAHRLPDREALIVLPQGMPVTVERSTFFEDGGLMSVRLRNGGFDAARVRIRIVVFADRRRLVGSASYCAGQMQAGTRQDFMFPLEVRGVTVRHHFAVFIDEVVTERRTFAIAEPLATVIQQARNAVDLRGSMLTADEAPGTGAIPECPCECEPAEALAREGCGEAGPSAFTCTPMFPGCSLGFTCKP